MRDPGIELFRPGKHLAMKPAGSTSILHDLANMLRGLFMGGADIVPGVSGGTVALIVGIYERLVTAISHIDFCLVDHLCHRRWRAAGQHLDARFLGALALGIVSGFLVMTMLMSRLLGDPVSRSLTMAAFFGLILGSAIMVSLMIRVTSFREGLMCTLIGLAGAGFAFGLGMLPVQSQTPSYGYVFFCASIAICAMILPGISGAMILLILGVYEHLAAIPGNLLRGQEVTEGLLMIVVFGSGAAISLVLFSRLLRWLLQHYHKVTMALLCGFMIGALPRLWPFQQDLTPEIVELKHKTYEPVWPDALDPHVLAAGSIALAAMLLVLIADSYGRTRKRVNPDVSPARCGE